MNLVTLENISKSYTERIVLDKINLGINEGDKIGVIGVNGTGKSTLLKIIASIEEPDEGTITKGKKIKISYLSQSPDFNSSLTILENVLLDQKAEEGYRNLKGEANAMLLNLGILESDVFPDKLSGGQKKRVALVRTLLTPADILVLDEPTNHLDSEMAEWLENYLMKYRGAFIMITHDRYFLDKVTNKIVEIDKGNLYSYVANYSKFIQLKAEREEMELATERKNKSLFKIELEWMMRGARARSTKQKAHIKRFEELRDRKEIEVNASVQINTLSTRLGKKTMILQNVKKELGRRTLIHDFSYTFLPDDRIGIIGANGCGKSTLLNIMTRHLEIEEGHIEVGDTVKIGYFSQENEYMDETIRVIDYIKETGEFIETMDGTISASQMCEKFLFTSAMQYSLISKLSGGEKRRLYLLKILMEAPNILILDEPTNDLDIQTLTILEQYLDTFDGIVIAVSHDRYFLNKVVDRIFAFEGNGIITRYEGNYNDYKEKKLGFDERSVDKQENTKKENQKSKGTWKKKETKLKFTYKEEMEYKTIDEEIETIEKLLSRIEEKIMESATDYSELTKLTEMKEKFEQQLEEKMSRWVYLTDLAEQIGALKNL